MNKELFKKLCMNYGKDANKELYELWNDELKDYDPYYLQLAIDNIVKNDKFFPTISRVIEEMKVMPYEEIPDWEKKRRMKEKGVEPEWLDKVFEDEEVDEETEKEFEDFKSFIEEFRK